MLVRIIVLSNHPDGRFVQLSSDLTPREWQLLGKRISHVRWERYDLSETQIAELKDSGIFKIEPVDTLTARRARPVVKLVPRDGLGRIVKFGVA